MRLDLAKDSFVCSLFLCMIFLKGQSYQYYSCLAFYCPAFLSIKNYRKDHSLDKSDLSKNITFEKQA